MHKLKPIYRQIHDVICFLNESRVIDCDNQENGFILDEDINPNHYTRQSVLELMHQVKFIPEDRVRPISIDQWFWKEYGIEKNIEWISVAWQFRVILERLLESIPYDQKYDNTHLGFADFFE